MGQNQASADFGLMRAGKHPKEYTEVTEGGVKADARTGSTLMPMLLGAVSISLRRGLAQHASATRAQAGFVAQLLRHACQGICADGHRATPAHNVETAGFSGCALVGAAAQRADQIGQGLYGG